jgi:hypothetical protein
VRLKLDENFDVRITPALTERGHDVENVYEEDLSGSPDEDNVRANGADTDPKEFMPTSECMNQTPNWK